MDINLGIDFHNKGQFEEAEKVYLDNNVGNDFVLGEIYYQMAESYFKVDNIKKAIEYTSLAKEKFEQVQNREEYAKSLMILSQEYSKKGDILNAVKYSKKTLDVYKEIEKEKNISLKPNHAWRRTEICTASF